MSTETHYVVDIRVQRVDKVTTSTGGSYNTPTKTETTREVTEVAHVVHTDKLLPHLIQKSIKHLQLVGEFDLTEERPI